MPGADEFFVDANIIIYRVIPGAYHAPCLKILEAIAEGRGSGRTSPSVLEEIWHLELLGKAGNLAGLTELAFALFTPLLPVTDDAFRLAREVEAGTRLGTNDRLHVGTCLSHGIRTIVSADAAFDRVPGISRVDPLDQAALARLGV